MSKNKKITLLVLGLLIVCLSFTGVSYAMWQVNHSQSDENIVNVGCFETSTDLGTNAENSAISLDKHFPISDVEGMKLTPFTFTITNTCTTIAAFQVNLETMSTSTIGKQYIKVAVNNNKSILNTLGSVETTIANASSSNMLESGSLYPGQSISFDIRLWVDEATTIEDLGADDPNNNLTYAAKVTLATSAKMYTNTAVDTIMKLVEGEGSSSTDVITKDAPNGATCTNTLAYDNTADNNLRYVGSNPCNYVCFNGECPTDVTKYYVKNLSTGNDANWGIYDSLDSCELDVDNSTDYECTPITMADGGWRIIGVMNNVDDGTGKSETRLKLIRNDSLGDYSWDVSSKTIDNGYGINEWAASSTYDGADIMRELNTDYLNTNLTNNPMWFSYQEGYTDSNYAIGRGQNTEFDRTKVLTTNAQELIGDAIWHTGTYDDTSENNSDINASQVYINEKNNNPSSTNNGKYCSNTYSDCNDEITRTTTWKGLVALINVSDYMYSTSGGSTLNRENCLTTSMMDNGYWGGNDCSKNSWINNGTYQFLLSPNASAIAANFVVAIDYHGHIDGSTADYNAAIRPSVYLLSSTKIIEGNGTTTNPYKFG